MQVSNPSNSFDEMAQKYKNAKELPIFKDIIEFTMLQTIGDLKGLKVLDLACDEGNNCRIMRKKGASEVLGVDISPEMIDLAESSEKSIPLGCKYLVHDASTLEKMGEFDLVVAIYLLNYAQTKGELRKFCEVAYKNLKKGGRFIGFNDNPFHKGGLSSELKKYGFTKESPEIGRKEGDPIKYTFYLKDGSEFSFDDYWLSPKTYEDVFKETGFEDFKWEGPFLDDSLTKEERDKYDVYMANPPGIGFSMKKMA